MSAVNFDQVAKDPALFAARKASAARAARLLGGKKQIGTDIDKDIRGSLWAGHVEETPGMEGSYFNFGTAGRPEDTEFSDVHGNKRSGTAEEIASIRDLWDERHGGQSGEDDGDGEDGGEFGKSGDGMLGDIENLLRGGMSGASSRYDDATMSRLKGQAFEQGKSALGQEMGAINQESAREGLGGPAVAALRNQARISNDKDYSSTVRDLANKKVQADYEDKRSALQDAMNYVNQTREYQLGKARNQIERDRIESEATIARERIASESSMLDRQLAAQAEMQAASARSGAAGQNSSQNFQREMANLRHDWELENRDYMMPIQLAQLAL